MVNIANSTVDPDSPAILREILQNKEKHIDELEKSHCNIMQDNQNAILTAGSMVTGTDVNGDSSARSDQDSACGSDEESSFLEQSRADETEMDDAKSDRDENRSPDMTTQETKEAKRARVENILSSMQHPAPYVDVESMYGLNEQIRKQKRKQTLPHQHDTAAAKIRRLETSPYDEELWNLRNHLSAVQNYFRHYDEGIPKQINGYNSMENIHRLHQAYFARQAEDLQRDMAPPVKASPVQQQKEKKLSDDRFNIADHVRETVNANRGLSQGVADLDDKELNELIANLKSKIEEAVSVTVDKELAKFFQRRSDPKPKETQSSPGSDKPKEENHHNSNIENKSPEQEKKQNTDHSLNHILQMPDRNSSNGFRLPERQSAFELPKLNGGLPDIPRPAFPHPPPLGYPPLSFYLPSNLHASSLYSCPIVPPEQTEALSLVVNTPKKKRTKVTDTRLSPRAARALLHDNVSLGSAFDAERSLSSTFGPVNPGCLPTSVAIPNPSLQHSDILSFYKSQQPLCSSPIDNERNTPCSSNSPSESAYSFIKNDFFNDSDGFDSLGKHTISFLPYKLYDISIKRLYLALQSYPDITISRLTDNVTDLYLYKTTIR